MSTICRAFVAFILLLSPVAALAGETGEDPRLEAYELPVDIDHFAEVDVLVARWVDIMPLGPELSLLLVEPWTSLGGAPLCPDEEFYAQAAAENAPRSGFLVGDDLVITAPHSSNAQGLCNSSAIILDFGLQSPSDPLGGPIPPGGSVLIENSKIFDCVEVVGCGNEGPCGEDPPGDWALFRLDRDTGRLPIKIARSLSVEPGDPAVVVGHPSRIPFKAELSSFGPVGENAVLSFGAVAGGSSGGMIADRDSGRAVGTAVSGGTDTIFFPLESCYRQCFEPVCSPNLLSGTATWVFAEVVPQVGMELAVGVPGSPIEHYGPPGGPFTNDSVELTLFVDPFESRDVPWQVPAVLNPLVAPNGDENSPSSGTLTAREPSITFPLRLTSAAYQLAAATYEQSIEFHDLVYRTADSSDHRLVVGVDGFAVDPEEPFVGEGPGAPAGATKTYEILNRWPVSHLVEATGSAPWIELNGSSGEVSVLVDPEGSADLDVHLDGTGLPPGVYAGTVDLVSRWGGDILHQVELQTRMDVGREIFAYTGPPVPFDGDPVTIPVDVIHYSLVPTYVADVDVRVTTDFISTTALFAEARLRSPEGTEVVLADVLAGNVIYDDDTNPPLESLSAFNGEGTDGTWELIVTPEPMEAGTILAFEVRLHVTSSPPK